MKLNQKENMQSQKKLLKIINPHHINTKNYMKDGSIIEIVYLGHEIVINAADNQKYKKYKFKGETNIKYNDILFEIHTKIKNNNVQFNVWKGATMAVSGISIDIIRDRDALINYMINEIKKL